MSIGIGGPAGRRMLHGKRHGSDGIRHPVRQLHGRHVDRHGFGRGFRHARSARSRGFLAHGNGRNGHAEMGYTHRVRAEPNRLPDGRLHRRNRPRRPRCGRSRQTLLLCRTKDRSAAPAHGKCRPDRHGGQFAGGNPRHGAVPRLFPRCQVHRDDGLGQ